MPETARKFTDYLLLIGTFITGVVFGIFIIYQRATISEDVDDVTPASSDANSADTTAIDATPGAEVSAYLVWWDQEHGFETLKENADSIDTVHPFWYQMKSDGTIEPFSGAEDQEIINFCKNNNIEIIPVISNEHDPLPVSLMLESATTTQDHIDAIVTLVEENGYDGIEIDYESLNEDDREGISEFMNDLSTELHERDYLLTAAVHAKTSDAGSWSGPAAQDWEIFNEACDTIKIMTYDYHWSTSEAGDIAPLSWMRDVLDYAVTVIDKEKIQVGIHFYGYDWVGEEGESVTYSDVQELIDLFGPVEIETTDEGEKMFTYLRDGTEHTVYFSDSSVVETRAQLAVQYEIGGVGIWRIGNEDPEIWDTFTEIYSQ